MGGAKNNFGGAFAPPLVPPLLKGALPLKGLSLCAAVTYMLNTRKLVTETNDYHCFNFTEKLSYEV
jgi:hypothetical protein